MCEKEVVDKGLWAENCRELTVVVCAPAGGRQLVTSNSVAK